MPSMQEVVIGPEVDLLKDITFSFTDVRSSGSTIIVKEVSLNGFFYGIIYQGDELMSFAGIEASKFKDLKSLLAAIEAIR